MPSGIIVRKAHLVTIEGGLFYCAGNHWPRCCACSPQPLRTIREVSRVPHPWQDPSVKDGEMLLALYEAAEMYRNGEQDAKAGEQEEMFEQKLTEVARGLLGVEISSTFVDAFISGIPDWEDRSGQICGSASDIPAHLAEILDVEWYGAFMEKYSAYPIELILHDERPKLGFHYGFIAALEDGKYASTYLHVDPCTGTVTDAEGYLLTCRRRRKRLLFQHEKPKQHRSKPTIGGFLRDAHRPVAPVALRLCR